MGARGDAVKVNGKQYLRKTETVEIDLDDHTVDRLIHYLNGLREQYGGDAYISLEPHVECEFYEDHHYAVLNQTLQYERIETDQEREKRLERNKKRREQKKVQQQKQEQLELERLEKLAKKHGKKVV